MNDAPVKSCLIFGCGNPLFGDDGFGPGVIETLESSCDLPPHVTCADAGTAIRDLLFDILLTPDKPDRIIVVDAADRPGRLPGEIFEIDVDEIDVKKTSDFSLHQFPTTNMLKELKDHTQVDIRVLVVQIEHIPEEICPGMSDAVKSAIPGMCDRILEAAGAAGTSKRQPNGDVII